MNSKRKIPSLRNVRSEDYSITWDPRNTSCAIRHKSGKGGALGCGCADSISVFSGKGKIIVLAVNYPARYACIETFSDDEGPDELVFADPKDIEKIFGGDFASVPPKKIAEILAAEL